nr:D-alanyl-lipoteichoic acid biosynthesis protein DltD [Enterococcus faecium]
MCIRDKYQETELSILANQIGERETTNNPFGLKNDFYTHRIRAPVSYTHLDVYKRQVEQ